MDPLATTSPSSGVVTAITQVQPNANQVTGVATVSGVGNITGVTTVPTVAQVVGTPIPTISQVWYNCGPEGLPQLVTANGQSVVELSTADLARQFNQQVQTPYGNIQVQVQPMSASQVVNKAQEETIVQEIPKPAPKAKVRQTGNERVPCPTCGKTVSCNATLRDHMRTHTGERPFVCSECGLAFAQRSNLRMHKRLHTGERPYMCGICGKTFARSSHLPAHMRTHTGEKPYVCEECDHAFITAQQLKNHFRVHTGEKPWKCDMCTAAFTHSSSLSTHKKKHTGRKPFQCDKCQKCFFFTSALDKHMKVHSKARPFKCDDCDKSFKYKESLTVHKEKYCGKELSKKPRAPRRPDARKPGPKPGSGRKYVQKRRGRPRGRPRKRGRWNRARSKRYVDIDEDLDMDAVAEGDSSSHSKDDESCNKKYFEDEDEEDEEEEEEEEIQQDIPTAELKVEVISPEEAEIIHLNRSSSHSAYSAQTITENPEQITGDIIQMQPAHEIHLDETTALTIVSAEEAEQQVTTAGVQLVTLAPGVPLQFVQHEGEDGQITHQYISREGIQMWYPRQFQ
ncbi:Zinc finger protein [Armadillidium vulgare]|nr:Zinc finger protein [Armadillidium vulgare]